MTLPLVKVAVVGHTNTGKTSLLRTLTRDVEFGEVSDRPATTRHVEGTSVSVDGETLLELYDTPGLEDSIGLLDHLEAMRGGRRVEGIELIKGFLAGPEAGGAFAQEAKAIGQVLACDIALYVIDARDRVLGKHRDELDILARCARPVVPVLNFTASADARTSVWREHLSRAAMHAVAEFDTVVLDKECEQRLFEKMQTLLDGHRATLGALIDDRRRQRAALIKASAKAIGEMLIDVAAHAVSIPVDDLRNPSAATAADLETLKQRVRDREQRCVEQLLELHRFRPQDCEPDALPIADGQWGLDLFSPAAVKEFGLQAGGAAAAGALVGLVVDVMTIGTMFGAGTALGAGVGGLIGAGRLHGKRLMDRARGFTELRCDDATLQLLAVRQATLARALLWRGHASQQPVSLKATGGRGFETGAKRKLLAVLAKAKARGQWSRLGTDGASAAISDPARQSAVGEVATLLETLILEPAATTP